MKILYYDCFAGISGDMNLGAMIDLGVDKNYLLKELGKLNLSGYTITISREKRKSIEGTRFNVILANTDHDHTHHHAKKKRHPHHHEHHNDHIQRNLKDIDKIIDASSLTKNVKALSKSIFSKLARAEAKIHGKPVDEIHFHEVGAVDSIIDIVGTAICLDFLNIDTVLCSPVELGGGFVKCRHGTLPVPAPATMEILKGVPVKTGAVTHETTTPTGAAILATIVSEFTDKAEFTIDKVGYGIGSYDLDIPNILRVIVGRKEEMPAANNNMEKEKAAIIECNIDDMNPELYDHVMETLFKHGAVDVYISPIIMKKSRPAHILSVLCPLKNEHKILETLFMETTTLGVRKYYVDKLYLKRDLKKVKTRFGLISVKTAYYNGHIIKAKPEYEDCKRIAKEKNIPISKIYNEITNIVNADDKKPKI